MRGVDIELDEADTMAERALFAGDLAHPSVLLGALAAIALAALGLFVGTRAIRRSVG